MSEHTKYFFITGPPRSGTTWLANLLTDHQTVCFHELAREKGGVDATIAHLKAQQRAFVGDCGPLVREYEKPLREAFPGAKWIEICGEDGGGSSDGNNRLYIPAKKQFEEPTARLIWELCCPGLYWDADRFHILSQMRVTTLEERAFGLMNPNMKRLYAKRYDTPSTELDRQYNDLLREMCGPHTDAFEWLNQAASVWLTWDHIVDGDPVDLQMADDMFQDMLLKWPFNAFYRAHAQLLVPVLSNCIAAWHYANQTGDNRHACRVYTDPALTVAYILGGRELRDKYSTRLKDLNDKKRIEDDTMDGEIPKEP